MFCVWLKSTWEREGRGTLGWSLGVPLSHRPSSGLVLLSGSTPCSPGPRTDLAPLGFTAPLGLPGAPRRRSSPLSPSTSGSVLSSPPHAPFRPLLPRLVAPNRVLTTPALWPFLAFCCCPLLSSLVFRTSLRCSSASGCWLPQGKSPLPSCPNPTLSVIPLSELSLESFSNFRLSLIFPG